MGLFSYLFYPVKVWQEDKVIYVSRLYKKTFYTDLEKTFSGVSVDKFAVLTYIQTNFFNNYFTLSVHYFFAPEIFKLFKVMYEKTKRRAYYEVTQLLLKETWMRHINDPDVSIDISSLNDLKYELKDYQKSHISEYFNSKNKLQLRGCIMNFDPGMGKTFTAIALSLIIKKQTIIFCPNSLISVWYDEIRNLIKKEVSICVIGESKYDKDVDYDYYICNYEKADRASSYIRKNIMIILDEAHNIRNLDTIRAQAIVTLREVTRCSDISILTGTPVKGLLGELIPIIRLLDPKFDDNALQIFSKMFRKYTNFSYVLLRYRLEFLLDVKVKEEFLTLPEKIEEEVLLQVKDSNKYLISTIKEEITIYAQERLKVLNSSRTNNINKFKSGLEVCVKYKIITYEDMEFLMEMINDVRGKDLVAFIKSDNNARFKALYDKCLKFLKYYDKVLAEEFLQSKKSTMSDSQKAMGEAMGKIFIGRKVEAIDDMVSENINIVTSIIKNAIKKTIIFSNFTAPLLKLEPLLKERGIDGVMATGLVKDIPGAVKQFKTEEDKQVMYATIQKMCTGHTLIVANVVLFLDMPYRNADFLQAQDRAHRIGQDAPVYIYKILLDTGTDKNIITHSDDILKWSALVTGAISADTDDDVPLTDIIRRGDA